MKNLYYLIVNNMDDKILVKSYYSWLNGSDDTLANYYKALNYYSVDVSDFLMCYGSTVWEDDVCETPIGELPTEIMELILNEYNRTETCIIKNFEDNIVILEQSKKLCKKQGMRLEIISSTAIKPEDDKIYININAPVDDLYMNFYSYRSYLIILIFSCQTVVGTSIHQIYARLFKDGKLIKEGEVTTEDGDSYGCETLSCTAQYYINHTEAFINYFLNVSIRIYNDENTIEFMKHGHKHFKCKFKNDNENNLT